METKNAKIESAMLGFEGHGILTCMLYLDYDGGGSSKAFGGYNLNSGAELLRWVKGVLKVVGVENWEDLKGKVIRVQREDTWNGKIVKIGNLLEDKWFSPSEEK